MPQRQAVDLPEWATTALHSRSLQQPRRAPGHERKPLGELLFETGFKLYVAIQLGGDSLVADLVAQRIAFEQLLFEAASGHSLRVVAVKAVM